MARDYLEIAPTPVDEPCQQVGTPSYDATLARAECRAFINQLRRQFGEEPEGARLSIKSNPHDFGTYLEVVCHFDDEIRESVEYAFKLEGETPEEWDLEARLELGLIDGEWNASLT